MNADHNEEEVTGSGCGEGWSGAAWMIARHGKLCESLELLISGRTAGKTCDCSALNVTDGHSVQSPPTFSKEQEINPHLYSVAIFSVDLFFCC